MSEEKNNEIKNKKKKFSYKNGNEKSELISKLLSKEVILYIVFGIVTTLVNWVSFYILNKFLNMNENIRFSTRKIFILKFSLFFIS